MLTIICDNIARKSVCGNDICCNECRTENCPVRCNAKVIDECIDFYEDID